MKNILLFSASGLALAHMTIILLRVMPTNPVSNNYRDFVISYTGLFPQEWVLFAPEPPTIQQSTEYRCKSDDGNWNAWTNLSDIYLDSHNRYRLSYHMYANRRVTGSMRELTTQRELLTKKMNCPENNKQCIGDLKASVQSLPQFKVVTRIMRDACREHSGIDPKFVHFRMKQSTVPKFSERQDQTKINESFYSYPFAFTGANP